MAQIKVNQYSIPDDAITLAKMASGTDGNIITYDASGNPAVVASGTSGHFLKSQGANTVPVFAAAGASGSMVLSEKRYDEVSTILASSTTYASGNTSSFTKTESSSDSYIVYTWNGYLADYANTGSDSVYRLNYTPSGGSATQLTNRVYIDMHTSGHRQYLPVCLNYTITSLNAGTHTFTFEAAHSSAGGANNNTQYETDSFQDITIREVLI